MICGLDIRVTCSVQHALALGWKNDNISWVYSIVPRNISALLSEYEAAVRYGLFSQAAQTNDNNLYHCSVMTQPVVNFGSVLTKSDAESPTIALFTLAWE